jgi:hypothetical protein
MKKQSFFIKYLIQKQTPSYISSNSMPRNPIPFHTKTIDFGGRKTSDECKTLGRYL